jgi:hypothetical protein
LAQSNFNRQTEQFAFNCGQLVLEFDCAATDVIGQQLLSRWLIFCPRYQGRIENKKCNLPGNHAFPYQQHMEISLLVERDSSR